MEEFLRLLATGDVALEKLSRAGAAGRPRERGVCGSRRRGSAAGRRSHVRGTLARIRCRLEIGPRCARGHGRRSARRARRRRELRPRRARAEPAPSRRCTRHDGRQPRRRIGSLGSALSRRCDLRRRLAGSASPIRTSISCSLRRAMTRTPRSRPPHSAPARRCSSRSRSASPARRSTTSGQPVAENDRLVIGFNRPFSELAARLGEEVRAAAGPIQLVYRVASPAPAGHWLNDPLQGGGRILGEACHMFDFANWLCGTPERVFAAAPPAPRGAASTESATTTIQYADGSVATVHYSGVGSTSMPKERIEVMRGDRSWILDDFSTLTTFGPDGERTERARGDKGHAALLGHRARGDPRRRALRAGPRRRVPRAERRAGRARFDRLGRAGGRPAPAGQERLMCGICGILATRDDFDVGEELVTTMRETIVHRGPDDGGSWYSPEHRVALAHRRLSIIDLSPAGHQPMTNEDGTVWLTFGGEIYNHMELRPELEAKGHRYQSRTDTETIIHLYEEEGPGCLERLDGMFHLAIWDSRTRELHLARDRLGKKPLYYAQTEGGLVFGSEIKALLVHPAVRPELDEEAFFHYLTFVCTPAPLTMFKGIRKLAPAELMTVRADGSTTSTTYWSPMSDEAAREVAAADRARARRAAPAPASGIDRPPDDVRRPVRSLPLRRARLVDERRAHVRADDGSRADLLGRLRPRVRALQRAGARAEDRAALRHRPPRDRDRRRRPGSVRARPHLPPGRAPGRLGRGPAPLRLEARARQRDDRRPDRRGLGRALPRVPELHQPRAVHLALLGAVPARAGRDPAGDRPRGNVARLQLGALRRARAGDRGCRRRDGCRSGAGRSPTRAS